MEQQREGTVQGPDDGAEADGGLKKNGEVGMESGREVLLRFGISCNLMLNI